jgi:hypothetical protein
MLVSLWVGASVQNPIEYFSVTLCVHPTIKCEIVTTIDLCQVTTIVQKSFLGMSPTICLENR